MRDIIREIISGVKIPGDRGRVLIAIDGRCGSGKSTLADLLSKELCAPVVHMDDFFLRPEDRTAERLALPGGNSDRERLVSEVLLPARDGGVFEYGAYSCSIGAVSEMITVPESDVCVIEGSYSCHPDLWDYFDLHVFLTVDPAEQMRRIREREGAKSEMFRDRWIPMEEKYFEFFGIADKCELVYDTTDM